VPAWLDKLLGKSKEPEFKERTASQVAEQKRQRYGVSRSEAWSGRSTYPTYTDMDGDGIPDSMDPTPYDNIGGTYNATDGYGDGDRTGQEPVQDTPDTSDSSQPYDYGSDFSSGSDTSYDSSSSDSSSSSD
jgi:hypothetical protein